jgi:hypothetical protein
MLQSSALQKLGISHLHINTHREQVDGKVYRVGSQFTIAVI